MKVLLIIFQFMLVLNVFSQDTTNTDSDLGIKLEKENGDSFLIESGSKIKVICRDKKYNGRYRHLDNNAIMIEKDTININEIDVIGYNKTARKVVGIIFLSTGIATPVGSLIYDATHSTFLPSIILFVPVGLAQIIFGTGHLAFKKRYNLKGSWKLTIE